MVIIFDVGGMDFEEVTVSGGNVVGVGELGNVVNDRGEVDGYVFIDGGEFEIGE